MHQFVKNVIIPYNPTMNLPVIMEIEYAVVAGKSIRNI